MFCKSWSWVPQNHSEHPSVLDKAQPVQLRPTLWEFVLIKKKKKEKEESQSAVRSLADKGHAREPPSHVGPALSACPSSSPSSPTRVAQAPPSVHSHWSGARGRGHLFGPEIPKVSALNNKGGHLRSLWVPGRPQMEFLLVAGPPQQYESRAGRCSGR